MEKVSPDESEAFARALRVGVFHGSSLIDNELFTGRGEISVGSDDDSDVHLDGQDVPRHFPLFKCTRSGVKLRFDDHMSGAIQLEHHGTPLSLDELRRVSVLHDGVREIDLPPQAEGRIEVGHETLLFQGLRRAPRSGNGIWLAVAIIVGAAVGLALGAAVAQNRRHVALPFWSAGPEVTSEVVPAQASTVSSPGPVKLDPITLRARDREMANLTPRLAWTPLFGAEEPSAIDDVGTDAPPGPWASTNAGFGDLRSMKMRPMVVSAVFVGRKAQVDLPRVDRRIETFHPDGALTPSVVAAEIEQRSGGLRAVYERALRRNPRMHGAAELRFVIGRDGTVSQVDVRGVPDREFGADLAAVASGWRFPMPSDGPVTVDYPFTLRTRR